MDSGGQEVGRIAKRLLELTLISTDESHFSAERVAKPLGLKTDAVNRRLMLLAASGYIDYELDVICPRCRSIVFRSSAHVLPKSGECGRCKQIVPSPTKLVIGDLDAEKIRAVYIATEETDGLITETDKTDDKNRVPVAKQLSF